METPAPAHAGVRFPPPLLYAAALVAGWLLHRSWPLPIAAGESTVRVVGAMACVLASFLIGGAAVTSRALDGWQLRTGSSAKPATIKAGAATIPLPDKLDPSKLLLQIREPSSGAEWTDVFARVGV